MKVDVLDLQGKKVKSVELPIQFNEDYRPDIIKRAIHALWSKLRQPYGAKEGAGMRYSAKLSRRRRDFKGSYGHGMSRAPRKSLWRRGTQFGFVGAEAPGTVGGRRAHAPKAYKIWEKDINRKERRKAIRSAISASALNNKLLIVENKFEDLKKTKDVLNILKNLGFREELERLEKRKIRAGRGKTRGRKYRTKVGPLFVVSKNCDLMKSARNIQGVEIIDVKNLNAMLLTRGQEEARQAIWSDDAVSRLDKEGLFLDK